MHTNLKIFFTAISFLACLFSYQANADEKSLEPHHSEGSLQYIDQGDVLQLPNSEYFVVRERHIGGTLTGSIGGLEGAPYLLTYKSYVPISTQSGPVAGTLVSLSYELYFRGQSYLAPTPVSCTTPDGMTCIATDTGNFVPGLWVQGKGYFKDGAEGKVDMSLWLIPIFDAEGHLTGIYKSGITLDGEWAIEPWQLQGKKR